MFCKLACGSGDFPKVELDAPVTHVINDMSDASTLLLSAGLAAASEIVSLALRPFDWRWPHVLFCGALVAVVGALSVVVPAKSLELPDGVEQAMLSRLFTFIRSMGVHVGKRWELWP